MFSNTTKTMLKNVIKHTDTHNRIVEETDMWKLLEQVKQRKGDPRQSFLYDDRYDTSVKQREGDPRQSFLYDDRYDMSVDHSLRASRHAYMDDGDNRDDDGKRKSTFWQRQLHKAEEADPDRWGHSGFKELYPQNFHSDRSEESEDSEKTPKKRKKEKKKRKHKREKEDKKNKSRKNRNRSSSECKSESRKHKYKSRKSRSRSSSESDDDSYKQKDDFQRTGKNQKYYVENMHHLDKMEKYSKDNCKREHCVKLILVNKPNDHYRGSRENDHTKNIKRKYLDPSYEDRRGDKRKHSSDDLNETLKKKRMKELDGSPFEPDCVRNSSSNSYSDHADSKTTSRRKKVCKKHKEKHKSKKKHKHSREV